MSKKDPIVGLVMGSKSDWKGVMEHCSEMLKEFGIKHDVRVISAHRTPRRLEKFISEAEKNNYEVIIAAAGGAAHLAGVTAALTTIPVLGVPMPSVTDGIDSLLSTVQMPAGVPVATLAIGKAGAKTSALFAIAIAGALVFALTIFGIIETSNTLRLSIPLTCNLEFNTVISSFSLPILHVPTGCQLVLIIFLQ